MENNRTIRNIIITISSTVCAKYVSVIHKSPVLRTAFYLNINRFAAKAKKTKLQSLPTNRQIFRQRIPKRIQSILSQIKLIQR